MDFRNSKCPYRVDEIVIYRPSAKGYSLEMGQRLIPEKKYKIRRIEKDLYVVVDGNSHPGGGLHWSEFSKNAAGTSESN